MRNAVSVRLVTGHRLFNTRAAGHTRLRTQRRRPLTIIQPSRLGFANFGFNDGLVKLLATHKRTDVPDFDRWTKTSRGESLTVGTKGHTTNGFGVSL